MRAGYVDDYIEEEGNVDENGNEIREVDGTKQIRYKGSRIWRNLVDYDDVRIRGQE